MKINWPKIKGIAINLGMFLPAIFIIDKYGFSGDSIKYLFIAYALMGLVIAYITRETWLVTLRTIETTLFGKPLDKEYWEEGEKPKLGKLVWKKKKEPKKKK